MPPAAALRERDVAGRTDEIEALQALLKESRQARAALEDEIRALKRRIASLESAHSQRPGAAGSAGTQLEFALGGEAAAAPIAPSARSRDRRAVSLVREPVVLEAVPAQATAPSSCPSCGGPLAAAGEEISELLEYRDGAYRLIEYTRLRAHCNACRHTVQAPAPPRPIPRALPGAGMLAHLLASRYQQHLSLYRQRQIYAAAGIAADRSTLADWVEASWLLLEPLTEALARHVLGGSHLQAASMPYPMLAHGSGRTRLGRLWLYLRDERAWGSTVPPAACFRFTADRSGAHARAHLAGFSGTLQGAALDEEPIYHSARLQLLECWGELRERIAQARELGASDLVEELLQRIDALYQIERASFGRAAEARRALRLESARPLLETLHARLRECLRELPKKAALSAALRFALAHWDGLERYSRDGRAQMGGLEAQRLLQHAVGERVGRGIDTHGARAAGLYGLIATARLNGAEPEHYLRAVLERLSGEPPGNWDALLPWALGQA